MSDARMSDVEALMWRLEKDPYLASTFGNVTILDRRRTSTGCARRLERASRGRCRGCASGCCRRRSASSPPEWVDDPDFDLDYHVRHIALPAPGTMRQLLDLAHLLVARPASTAPARCGSSSSSTGLEGGRRRLVQKMHHTITDGEGGVQLSVQFLDFERDARPTRCRRRPQNPRDGGRLPPAAVGPRVGARRS